MFEWALRGNLPIIGVRTDDPANFPYILQLIAEGPAVYLPGKASKTAMGNSQLFWTDDSEWITREVYTQFLTGSLQLVVCNFDHENPFIFDAGMMPTPPKVIEDFLAKHTDDPAPFMECLRGLSLKAASEAVLLTEARTGALIPAEVRKTRSMVNGGLSGLSSLDASYDFYAMPSELKEWLDLNTPYFLNPTHAKLVPRGMLLAGKPGTGKTMAGKVIAKHWQVPLYHLDISTVLSRYIGTSEQRLKDILGLLDREAPCVVIVDEVEKVINSGEDLGVISRILSQLLWWLQEHQSKVFVVMTTNDLTHIPPELYRPGRVDVVMHVKALTASQALPFALMVYESVVGKPASIPRKEAMRSQLAEEYKAEFSHAEVSSMVYFLIKMNSWMDP